MNDPIRDRIEQYKAILRSGRQILGERASGRTQAIIEFAHERMEQGEQIAIICGTWPHSTDFMRARFFRTFGDGCRLPILVKSILELRGNSARVLEDLT